MNGVHHYHHFRRAAAVLGAVAASVLVILTGATAAFAYPVPPPGGPAQPPRVQTIADRARRDRSRDRRRPGRTLDHVRTARRHLTTPPA